MTKRQITFSIHVSYATPIENLERSIRSLRTMLLEHEGVDNETIMVNFDTFADSYYNLFFNFYTKTTVWAENLDIREDINYKIIEILGAEGVEFAYPGQMVVVKQKHQNDPFQVNLNKEEKERA